MGTNPCTIKALKDLMEIVEELNGKPQFKDDKDIRKLYALCRDVIFYHARRQKGLPGGHPRGVYKYNESEGKWERDYSEDV